jgi:four helix bundle protein
MNQSPIFARTYDFLAWLIPLTVKFPRHQRFVMAAALQRETLRFQELLIEAAHQKKPGDVLTAADAELDKVRTHLRLSLEMGLVQPSQYEHAARLLTEIGKLLGGWMKTLQTS